MDWTHVWSALGNLATSGGLGLAGFLAFTMAAWPPRREAALTPWVAFLAAAGLIGLAVDEGLELHDRVGRWLYHERGVTAPGPVNHVDDLFVFAYMLVAVAVLVAVLPRLWRHRLFLGGAIVSGVAFAGGAGFDALVARTTLSTAFEETFEVAGALLLAATFAIEVLRGRTQALRGRAREALVMHGVEPRPTSRPPLP